MPEQKKELYSDISLAFLSHPVTNKLTRKTNREAVKQSVKSLILTDFFERPFKPQIGCSIRYQLFELFTPATKQLMENSIREVINNFEPRAEIIDVLVEEKPDLNALSISVAFFVLNDEEPVTFEVLLERVR